MPRENDILNLWSLRQRNGNYYIMNHSVRTCTKEIWKFVQPCWKEQGNKMAIVSYIF